MELVEIFRLLHSWTRWLVLLVAVVAGAWLLYGWLAKRPFAGPAGRLMPVFGGLIGLQWILGIILLIVYGTQTGFGVRHYWEHLVTMTVALAVAHAYLIWKRRDIPASARYRNYFLVIVLTLVLVVLGIVVLPEAIQWRFYAPG